MTRLEIHLDAETLQPIIQATLDVALRRLQEERRTDNESRLLWSKAEAVERLEISVSSLDRLVADDEIKAVKLSGRVLFSDDALRDWIARREAKTATDTAVQTWDGIVATRPRLAELEQHVLAMRVATSMPEYGRDWLEIDDSIYEIAGRGPAYQIARDHLHALYTNRVLEESDTTEVGER